MADVFFAVSQKHTAKSGIAHGEMDAVCGARPRADDNDT